jgi:hypothetical protein
MSITRDQGRGTNIHDMAFVKGDSSTFCVVVPIPNFVALGEEGTNTMLWPAPWGKGMEAFPPESKMPLKGFLQGKD